MIFDKSTKYYPLKYQILPHHYNGKSYLCNRKNSKCVVKRLSSSFTYTKNKTLEFNRGIEIPMFFLCIKLKQILTHVVLFIFFQFKSVVCFIT